MHDISDLERRGIPGVFVASDPFRDAAEVQSSALGLDTARVFVSHPIQDRTDDEIAALADEVVGRLVAALTGPS